MVLIDAIKVLSHSVLLLSGRNSEGACITHQIGQYLEILFKEFADPFFDNASPKPSLAIFKPEAVVEPTIADRDAAEIFFRTFPNYTFGMSPDGKFALESVSEGQNIAIGNSALCFFDIGSKIVGGIQIQIAKGYNKT